MSSNLIVNNIEVGAGATIYTAASNQLTFGTNGSEKVRITSTGAVGIGTNNPISGAAGARLAVHLDDNTSYAGGTARGNGIIVYNATAGGHSSLELAQRNSANTYGTVILNAVNPADGNNYGADFTIQTRATGSGNYGERLRIASDGNITIGQDGDSGGAPSAGYDELVIEGGNENIGMCFLSPAANNVTQQISFGDSNNNQSGRIIYNHASDYMSLGVGGGADNERLRITSAGYFGVGETPTTKVGVSLSSQQADGTDDASDWGAGGIFQLDASGSAANGNEILLLGAHSGGVGQIASGFGFGRENTGNWGTYLSFKTHSTGTSNIDELNERLRITSGGQVKVDNELRTNRIVPKNGLVSGASGGVIQVVFAENNTVQTFSFGNNSFSPQTVCSCTITPQSSNSKILVICSAGVFVDNETGMNFEWSLHLKRGSTLVGGNTQSSHFLGTNVLCSGINSVESAVTGNFHYMDSPATTSATTYNLCLQGGEARTYGVGRSKYNSPSTKYNYQNSSGCTITLMEITG